MAVPGAGGADGTGRSEGSVVLLPGTVPPWERAGSPEGSTQSEPAPTVGFEGLLVSERCCHGVKKVEKQLVLFCQRENRF